MNELLRFAISTLCSNTGHTGRTSLTYSVLQDAYHLVPSSGAQPINSGFRIQQFLPQLRFQLRLSRKHSYEILTKVRVLSVAWNTDVCSSPRADSTPTTTSVPLNLRIALLSTTMRAEPEPSG